VRPPVARTLRRTVPTACPPDGEDASFPVCEDTLRCLTLLLAALLASAPASAATSSHGGSKVSNYSQAKGSLSLASTLRRVIGGTCEPTH
jgi:hypothetical protein